MNNLLDFLDRLSSSQRRKAFLSAFVFILFIVVGVRLFSFNSLPMEALSYNQIIVSESSSGIFWLDGSVSGTREVIMSPYDLLVRYSFILLGLKATLLFLPGILLFLFLFVLLDLFVALGISQRTQTLLVLLFLISPATLFLEVSLSSATLVLLLLVLLLRQISDDRPSRRLLAYPLALLIVWEGLVPSILASAILYALPILQGNARRGKQNLALSVLFLGAIRSVLSAQRGSIEYQGILKTLTKEITLLGGLPGIALFIVLLSFIALFIVWRTRRNYVALISAIFSLALIDFFSYSSNSVFLSYLLLPLAVISLRWLSGRGWKLKMARKSIFQVIGYGLLFSSLVFMTAVASEGPPSDLVTTLKWIEKNTQPNAVIITDKSIGELTGALAKRKVLKDSGIVLEQKEIEGAYKTLLYSRNINDFFEKAKEYKISHILITPEMKEGLTWSSPEEGLLFLLRNEEHFQKIFSFKGYQVYELLYTD